MPVYLRITVGGKRAEMTSGLECDPEKWNTKSGMGISVKVVTRSAFKLTLHYASN